jgi:hypothetical protein
MSRIRNVKPEFFTHEGLQDLELENAGKYPMFVFEGLWGQCDRNGAFEWKPRTLKLHILPFLPFEMDKTLDILAAAGYIEKYTANGKDYGIIRSFPKHQSICEKERQNINIFPLPPDNSGPDPEPPRNAPGPDPEPPRNESGPDPEPPRNESGPDPEPPRNGGNLKSENRSTDILKSDILKSHIPKSDRARGGAEDKTFADPETGQENWCPFPQDRPLSPDESRRWAVKCWELCCKAWNRLGLTPECRIFLQIFPAQYAAGVIKIFQAFSLKDIKNAMANYLGHLNADPESYRPAMVFGGLATFLISGVPRYFDDEAIDTQFRIKKGAKDG